MPEKCQLDTLFLTPKKFPMAEITHYLFCRQGCIRTHKASILKRAIMSIIVYLIEARKKAVNFLWPSGLLFKNCTDSKATLNPTLVELHCCKSTITVH